MAAAASHRLESGSHTVGGPPSCAGFHAGPSWAATSAGSAGTTEAARHRPSAAGVVVFHRRASALNVVTSLCAVATVTVTGVPVQACAAPGRYAADGPRSTSATAPTATTSRAASSSGQRRRRPDPNRR